MMRKAGLLLLVLLLVVSGGCGRRVEQPAPPAAPAVGAYPMVLVDDAGKQVKIAAEPQRIVSLLPSLTETLFALGLGERVVGVTNFCNYPAEVEGKERVGGLFDLNAEKILALEPDVVLSGQMKGAQEVLQALETAGVTVVVFDPATMEDIGRVIREVAKLAGVVEKGEELAGEIDAGRKAMAAQVGAVAGEKAQVFVLLDTEKVFTVGDGEYMSEMIAEAGGVNAASGQGEGWLELSEEKLFELDPDIIIATFPMREQILTRPGWQALQAVREGRVYDVDGDLVSRPGPRVVLGLDELHRVFYRQ
jgi:iron complex transport system substrate-binding protein